MALLPKCTNKAKEKAASEFDSNDDFSAGEKLKLLPVAPFSQTALECATMENAALTAAGFDSGDKKPKQSVISALQGLFPQSALNNCTFNINISIQK